MPEPATEKEKTHLRVWAVASLIIAIAFLVHPVRMSIYEKGIRFLQTHRAESSRR